jgi:hypothetical protein
LPAGELGDHLSGAANVELADKMTKRVPVDSGSLTCGTGKLTNVAYFTAASQKMRFTCLVSLA